MQALLRGVSRSFYVSIRLLPEALRRPIAVAYLLARATDTLADTGQLLQADRRDQLETLANAIQNPPEAGGTLARFAQSLAGAGQDDQERLLLAALPDCLDWLHALAPADRDDIRTVLRHITRGQVLDLERFAGGTPPRALDSAAQLDEYTYLVAGCVGEFWTDLCFRHQPAFATLPQQEMRALGRDYGMGLQLVNILRDCGADLVAGRCYFPADQLAAAGLAPHDILAHPDRFAGVWRAWHAQAASRLAQGMHYADAVNSRRVRAAGALPALLGIRTLALLREAGPRSLAHRVKVPRREVHAVMARLALTLAGRGALNADFKRLRGQAAGSGWDNPAP